MEENKKKSLDKYKVREIIIRVLPFVVLAVLFVVFCLVVSAKGYRLDRYLKIVFNEGVVLAIVATGSVFIYTLGSFDISLGAATLFSATAGIMAYNASGSLAVMILSIFGVGIGCSLLNSVLASVFKIPAFVTTVAMMSVLSAVSAKIITTNGGALGGISIPSQVVKPLDNPPFKIILLAVFFLICLLIFNFLKTGRRQKFLGGNQVCAALTGIPYNRYAIIAFVMAGLGVGLGAFLTIVYTPSVTTTTASSIGMNIFVAIVFGGMPISGGARSKIYAAIVGGFSYIILNNILKILIDTTAMSVAGETIDDWFEVFGDDIWHTHFIDSYISGGYGASGVGVEAVIRRVMSEYGIPLDPTYTGKAFYGMEEIIKSCGLYKTKARDIVSMCRQIRDNFNGAVPDTIEKLTTLSGIGRKTANLIAGDIFHKPAVVVDTHCIRITGRLGLHNSKNAVIIEKILRELLPPEESNDFCHRLVIHGRAVCTARNPKCDKCCMKSFCSFAENNM